MKVRHAVLIIVALILQLSIGAGQAPADQLKLNDGRVVDGTVRKIDQGKVTVDVAGETQVFDVLQISGIDFETPPLIEGTPRLPAEHFTADMESKEMAGHVQDVEKAAASVREIIRETKAKWSDRKSVPPDQTVEWINARERLYAPLARYQEALNELYFHVLGKVDEYDQMVKEADSVYVGVKGWFNVGSSLVPSGMEKLPLKKYVPGNWYDTIFYEGYDRGYSEAAEKYRKDWTTAIE